MKTIFFLLSITALYLVPNYIVAQEQLYDRGFSAQSFHLSPGHNAFLTVEGADLPDGLSLKLGGLLGYQYRPVVLRSCSEIIDDTCTNWSDTTAALVKHYTWLDVTAAFSLNRIVEFGVALPVVLYQTGKDGEWGDSASEVQSAKSNVGLDDLRIHLKWNLLHTFGYADDKLGLALIPVVSLPLGNAVSDTSFMGNSSVTFHPKLAFGTRTENVRFGINAGFAWKEKKEFFLSEVGPRMSYGAAMEISMTQVLSGILELFGQSAFTGDLTENPLEGDAALRFTSDNGFDFTIGAGVGIIAAVGTPAFRLFSGIAWTRPGETDRDTDGILDDDDACPDDPEDIDRFEDSDGCPDLDNDKDGISDDDDRCPNEPEDLDNYQDSDGCSDPDNDKDGISDNDDNCPNEPEDPDSYQDDDGCPDLDNDKDGISDKDDNCPNEPEDLDEYQDDDGCPEGDKPLAVIEDDRIVILEKVYFATNKSKIKKVSYPVLDEVVKILNNNLKFEVRIEGHTDSTGSKGNNKRLSKRRAKSVMKYFTKAGVERKRFTFEGLGQDVPIDTNETDQGRTNNRRVEFHIID